MRRIRNRVGGLDVHRDSVTACVEIFDGIDVEVSKERFSTTATGIRELADWLATFEVELVVMEATGVYWKPVYYGLEDLFEEVWLVNAHHVKNVPGRKTDMSDAQWLADVAAHGMVRPSMVPPPSPSPTPCSCRPGTWPPPAKPTWNSAKTSTPNTKTPRDESTTTSANSKPPATPSPSPQPPETTTQTSGLRPDYELRAPNFTTRPTHFTPVHARLGASNS